MCELYQWMLACVVWSCSGELQSLILLSGKQHSWHNYHPSNRLQPLLPDIYLRNCTTWCHSLIKQATEAEDQLVQTVSLIVEVLIILENLFLAGVDHSVIIIHVQIQWWALKWGNFAAIIWWGEVNCLIDIFFSIIFETAKCLPWSWSLSELNGSLMLISDV